MIIHPEAKLAFAGFAAFGGVHEPLSAEVPVRVDLWGLCCPRLELGPRGIPFHGLSR